MKKITINTASPKPHQASILVIYTGGTLGMVYEGPHLVPFNFEHILERLPELYRFEYEVTVITLEPPIDSANIRPAHWSELAKIIGENYQAYDGFVVLHGTDTMAYTASALSFLLENLAKPVILTGAQLPIDAARSDGRTNFITALQIAGAKHNNSALVPEVCIYFDYFLYRGNRTRKVESRHFDAFASQNYPHLAEAGISIEYNTAFIQPLPVGPFAISTQMEAAVGIVKLFPGMSEKYVEAILLGSDLKAVVLETYGSGTAPSDKTFLKTLEKAIEKGLILLNISQCFGGMVMQGKYETSQFLEEMGVISGYDMTTEAAITKLMYLLNRETDTAKIYQLLQKPLRGEMGQIT